MTQLERDAERYETEAFTDDLLRDYFPIRLDSDGYIRGRKIA